MLKLNLRIKRKKANEKMAKRKAKPKIKRQLRSDLYYMLKGTIPLGNLRRMSLEDMQMHWDRDTFMNPEARKRKR